MRDRAENWIFVAPENFRTQSSKHRYRVDSRRSAQPLLWAPSQLTELRTSENPEEETNRSGKDAGRNHYATGETRPYRINRGDRTWLRKFPCNPCKTHRAHSQIGSVGRIRVRTPQNRCSREDY